MQEEKQYTTPQTEEVTLKDVILKMQDWWRFLLRKWLTIVICGLVGAGLGLTYALLKKPKYMGELTFVLEDSKSNPLSAYMGLASQFGIDLGGASGSGVFQGDNILTFLKSRLLIEKTLLSPVQLADKRITLVDYYIRITEQEEKFKKLRKPDGIYFPFQQKRENFSILQDSVLFLVQEAIVKSALTVEKPDKKLSFISVKCTSPSELFSKIFTERLVKQAIDFYVNTKIGRTKVNVDKLQITADSLEMLLNRKTYSLAEMRDLNQNPARQVAGVGAEVQARDKLVLQTMYGEVIKNLELSKMAMAQETPLVQIVDTPILPLKKVKVGRLAGLVVGGFLGGFLTLLALISGKIYRDVMNK
ncbi:lipopolysaccharide biosynthesis protein [Chitinophaga agrisoli]|uniref:Lipopolysaccharide biosynthesis protein n=1 Tax=Chitinophaga agrisoli TaxID=2607653 RepID=A0A5B2W0X7_9BACT|nr:lipopolysaccharide biosynthesis protein [Chitinophaga agrisoli]KAA2245341.1 lipopolysaccharide biosynthesis protein [Chitinophaga agrisoli]